MYNWNKLIFRFIVIKCADLVKNVLQRNNLPAVRQYLETFAINVYLKFPPLVSHFITGLNLHDFFFIFIFSKSPVNNSYYYTILKFLICNC